LKKIKKFLSLVNYVVTGVPIVGIISTLLSISVLVLV